MAYSEIVFEYKMKEEKDGSILVLRLKTLDNDDVSYQITRRIGYDNYVLMNKSVSYKMVGLGSTVPFAFQDAIENFEDKYLVTKLVDAEIAYYTAYPYEFSTADIDKLKNYRESLGYNEPNEAQPLFTYVVDEELSEKIEVYKINFYSDIKYLIMDKMSNDFMNTETYTTTMGIGDTAPEAFRDAIKNAGRDITQAFDIINAELRYFEYDTDAKEFTKFDLEMLHNDFDYIRKTDDAWERYYKTLSDDTGERYY